jgi:hypothetical protein
MKKVTEFEGYISGDCECFCLSKIPFEEWAKKNWKTWSDPDLLYPGDFFPKELRNKKCRFKITVEAEIVPEKIEEKTKR